MIENSQLICYNKFMKKFFVLLIAIFAVSLCVFAADKYPRIFAVRMNLCVPYSYQAQEDDATVTRTIGGWKNHLCRFTQTTVKADETQTVSCNFTREQLTNLYTGMAFDSIGESSAKETWDEYLSDENTCSAD